MPRPPALLLALGLALPAAADAPAWTARDLGSIATEAGCVETAVRALQTYATLFRAADLRRGPWMVALDGLDGQAMHALITCTVDGFQTRATLVIFSQRDGFGRLLAADRIAGFWNGHLREAAPPRP
jgi:hypothetical protein